MGGACGSGGLLFYQITKAASATTGRCRGGRGREQR
jgi:hypothetical protein